MNAKNKFDAKIVLEAASAKGFDVVVEQGVNAFRMDFPSGNYVQVDASGRHTEIGGPEDDEHPSWLIGEEERADIDNYFVEIINGLPNADADNIEERLDALLRNSALNLLIKT